MQVVADDDANPEVIWTFYEPDDHRIEAHQRRIIEILSPGLDRGRVTLFSGIDCNNLLPRLKEELEAASETDPILPPYSEVPETSENNEAEHGYSLQISVSRSEELNLVSDNPPQTDAWVGRNAELDLLRTTAAKLVLISGIGGQGKSALAGEHLRYMVDKEKRYELWDWRDCREEGDRLQTQLISIIIRLTNGHADPATLETKNVDAVIDLFFFALGQKKCLLVFDNVDHYIDLAHFKPVGVLAKLLDAAIERPHASQFVITCRPALQYDAPSVLSLPLEGLSLNETVQLFERRQVPKRDFAAIPSAYNLTEGHPLWLNIIAVQSTRRKGGLTEVVSDIQGGRGTLPENTLRSTWSTLNDRQQQVLRTMAELERPETEARLTQIIPSIARHRFERALKTLRTLNLIVVKSGHDSPDLLDLHPMVRQFIRREFGKQERERFINIVVVFFDRMIGRYRDHLNRRPSLSILEHWIQKAELELNRGHHESAVATVYEVANSLLSRGFLEEFVRIGKRVFQEIDWGEACVAYKDFDALVGRVVSTQIQLGAFAEAEKFIDRYENSIPGQSAQYINMCDLRTYLYWYQGQYDKAIHWGEQGERLLDTSKADTRFNTRNHLALAKRDSGQVEQALKVFLEGQSLDEVIASGKLDKDKGGSFYGNIGRCLQFMGRLDDALKVYKKSALLLESSDEPESINNRGYARLWIGEIYVKKGDLRLAISFLKAAIEHWRTTSPPRAREVEQKLATLLSEHPEVASWAVQDQWQPEGVASKWIHH